ncbi:hypothetical protein BZA70DRAFT_274907 [Myxozyma melibiosi]|uniref:Secreted protein n=1 Tax=Myxozyma melibiosi TaxID=54550 RepID=A0ABR1FA32_9ASCO
MRLNNATRTRLTTSLFSTTFCIAVLTVAAPHFLPCPATRNPVGTDSGDVRVQDRRVVLRQRRQSGREQANVAEE